MRRLQYFLAEAARSLKRGGLSQVIAVGTIALALFVFGAFLLVTSSLDRVVAGWSAAAQLSVYLRDDATAEDRAAIEMALAGNGAVERREFVSKEQAAQRFRRDFPDLATAADGVGGSAFPASIEARLRPRALGGDRVAALSRQLARLPGVADVRYDRQWLDRLANLIAIVRWVGVGLASALAAAAALTIAAVVRLTMFGRRDEVEIMQLVGTPLGAIRGPFVVEGVLQGGAGALAALAALRAVYAVMRARLPEVAGALEVQFLPLGVLLAIVVGGMLVGCIGGYIATRAVR
jgi:cell division transport system permease protein